MKSVYNMVLTPEFFGIVQEGAFDHWEGETVPVRGPDRRIIGEAKIASVSHRKDGQVWMVVESELDSESLGPGLRGIAETVRGRSGMSFSIPHQPRRDDDVARWLKAKRNEYDLRHPAAIPMWNALDSILDEYRARADYGLTLDDDMTQLPDGY